MDLLPERRLYPLAISYLQQALKLQEKNKTSDNPDIHYHLGWAYEKTQQQALARQTLNRFSRSVRNTQPQRRSTRNWVT